MVFCKPARQPCHNAAWTKSPLVKSLLSNHKPLKSKQIATRHATNRHRFARWLWLRRLPCEPFLKPCNSRLFDLNRTKKPPPKPIKQFISNMLEPSPRFQQQPLIADLALARADAFCPSNMRDNLLVWSRAAFPGRFFVAPVWFRRVRRSGRGSFCRATNARANLSLSGRFHVGSTPFTRAASLATPLFTLELVIRRPCVTFHPPAPAFSSGRPATHLSRTLDRPPPRPASRPTEDAPGPSFRPQPLTQRTKCVIRMHWR